mgnify:CR=1 FL=1
MFPKRCGHMAGKRLVAGEAFEQKIKAAGDARQDGDFVIIARTDAIAVEGFEQSIARANLYAEAGADVVFGVILGTGVGGGLVVNRSVLGGPNAIAGEWGHNPLPRASGADEQPGRALPRVALNAANAYKRQTLRASSRQ